MSDQKPADVLVIFGITGDLARVMTFHSLYRLEARGLLDCPIVGVAFDDWTLDQLKERARDSIVATGEQLDEAVFERFADAALVPARRLLGRRDLHRRRRRAEGLQAAGLLPRDPAVPLRQGRRRAARRGADEERARRRREAVRPRPRLGDGARGRAAPVPRGEADLPHRPLPREDGPAGAAVHALREHDARADLEPELRRVRPDHDVRGLRRRRPRPLLRPGRRAARRRRQPPDAGRRDRRRWRRPPAATRDTLKDAMVAVFRATETADPKHYVRGQHDGYRAIEGVDENSTTETFAALRLEIDNWRWSGVPVLHPHREADAGDADRGAARLQAAAAARLQARSRAAWSRTSS